MLGEQEDVPDAVREATDGSGADLVVDLVGSDESHAASLRMLARRGVYSVVGYGGTASAPSVALIGAEHTIAGNLVGSWIDLWELLQLHARGEVTLARRRTPSPP